MPWSRKAFETQAFLSDQAKADKEAAKKVLDERFALMRQIFRESFLAVNVAYVAWGEDAQWSRLGWERPANFKERKQ